MAGPHVCEMYDVVCHACFATLCHVMLYVAQISSLMDRLARGYEDALAQG